MRPNLPEKLKSLPDAPGVYLLKDQRGGVLYVGKAKSLRARVRSYLTETGDGRRQIPFLRKKLWDFDVLEVHNEKEAFLLENNLIKQHKPRYNVRLVDDKTYLSLRLSRSHPFPRFTTVRRRRSDDSRYFGPYSSARSIRSTLKLVYRQFGIRSCSDSIFANRTRPCLYYQIGQCLAPCVDYVTEADYGAALTQAEMFLSGDGRKLIDELRIEMQAHAREERYEQAAKVRDRIRAVQRSLERQDMSLGSEDDFDVIGHAQSGDHHCFVWLNVRAGRVIDTSRVTVRDRGVTELDKMLSSVLAQMYEHRPIPARILLGTHPLDEPILELVLSERRGTRCSLHVPQRGAKRRLLDLATTNAQQHLETGSARSAGQAALLGSLQSLLSMPTPPHRIECFDISNISGDLAVGSMVVTIDGEAKRSLYRRYRVKSGVGGDDYASMREVLTRRLSRGLDEGDLPDLLVVDGGRGQVAIASSVLEELGIESATLIGLAKGPQRNAGREGIHFDDGGEATYLPHADPRLHLLQRIRDEAHRFAITYHRKLRAKRTLDSQLLEIPGVGRTKARLLLRHFGSLAGVTKASESELCAVEGVSPGLAGRIRAQLDSPAE